ncbi:amidohydrolase family protein [Nonomuraea sp. NPDC050451]|uniref:amidohydrolase family protein n=1 Tax=Nonomuraea sp. NPDC050451 TaxID=3364364 RepID=UPI00379FC006
MTPLVVEAEAGWCGGRELHRPARVLVDGTGVHWSPGIPEPDVVRRVRVPGVLVPGLVDHHVHTDQIDPPALLAGGITCVRDLGAPAGFVFELARRSEQDPGLPRILPAGPFLTAPGGYPTDRLWAQEGSCRPLRDAVDAERTVHDLAAQGACLVKVAMNADAGPVLGDAELRAVVGAARDAGLLVVAHAEGDDQAERALDAGVDELAHVPWTHRLADEVIRRCAARTAWTSTMDIHGWGKDTPGREIAMDNLRRFARAGGRVRYGTDLGNGPLPLGVNVRELQALSDAELSPVRILASIATSARELAVLPGDPLTDPLMTSRVTAVVRAGVYRERTSG